ncbi:MAG: hypothetical protein K8U03_10030 [Planctomycetia bacterium]|nr:hypothetical protein [Planctomycetia bacterium]
MPFSHRAGFVLSVFALISLGFTASAPPAYGQATAADKLPMPEEISVVTKDGVKIAATYLASTKGKDAAVVILLHMFKGNRRDMASLGAYLQKQDVAVVMPDLRGHGDSTTVNVEGVDRKFDASTMKPVEMKLMSNDLEAIKKFLIAQNNEGKLNIERLGIIAAEMSVPVAVNWTVDDWSWPVLPTLKQGQDVKALVLLSPQMAFKTLNMSMAITNPQSPIRDKISLLLITGAEDKPSVADARRIEQTYARIRPKPEKIEDKTLFLEDTLKTKLVGTKLLGEKSLAIEELIAQFIELRLVAPTTYVWKERMAP